MSEQLSPVLQYRSGPDLAITLVGRPPEESSTRSEWNGSFSAIAEKCSEVLLECGPTPSSQDPLAKRQNWIEEVFLPIFDAFAGLKLGFVSGDADIEPFCHRLKNLANRILGTVIVSLPLTRLSSAPSPGMRVFDNARVHVRSPEERVSVRQYRRMHRRKTEGSKTEFDE
jgi:hypothetical protein